MTGTDGPTTVVLDLEGLGALDRFPRTVDAVALTFQASPSRRARVEARFPGARVHDAVPTLDGPWQAETEATLARLAALDPVVDGVPVLDCVRASLRDECAALAALRHAVADARRVVVAANGPSAPPLRAVHARGGISTLVEVEAAGATRSGFLRRVRTAGRRGLLLALAARLDPSHARRAWLGRRPQLGPADAVVTSSYAHATRAALEGVEATGGGRAVLVTGGPRAFAGLRLPDAVRVVSLAQALRLDRRRAATLRREAVDRVSDALARWGRDDDPWAPGPALEHTALGRPLRGVLVPEIVSGVVALRAVLERTGASRLVVGDEFSPVDRAAIHVARALSVRSVSRQHGVLDSHYLRERLLADEHLAWDEATCAWLKRRGAAGTCSVRAVPRGEPAPAARTRGRDVVVFLQPTDWVRVPFADWTEEALGAATRAAATCGRAVVVKPHPLQTVAGVRAASDAFAAPHVRVVADRTARDVLAEAAVAVTLDSSVAVDCRSAGVPCLSTAWYPGTYVEDLVELGWVVPCRSPEALEREIVVRLRAERPT